VILFGGDASWFPLQHIQNSSWDHSWGEQDLLCISRCSLFWIQPAHTLINLSVFQSIPCLFWSIYHITTCSLMLSTCSHKVDTKIHPDAPKNACGMQTVVGWVCLVITPWSPTQVTIHHNHLVLIMSHITVDSIVQTISWFMPSIIGNVQIFPDVSAEITDWISPALVLTRTQPGLPFFLIGRNPRANPTSNPTRISPYPMKPDLNLTSQLTLKANLTTNPILTWPNPTLNMIHNPNPNLTQSPS
jgi:hypothetical protein